MISETYLSQGKRRGLWLSQRDTVQEHWGRSLAKKRGGNWKRYCKDERKLGSRARGPMLPVLKCECFFKVMNLRKPKPHKVNTAHPFGSPTLLVNQKPSLDTSWVLRSRRVCQF